MKKLVPDPPLPKTTAHPFGRCDAGHPPLFTVNPDIEPHDALVHVALYLRCAYDTGIKAVDHPSLHAIELAEGLVEAMLDGIESAVKPGNSS